MKLKFTLISASLLLTSCFSGRDQINSKPPEVVDPKIEATYKRFTVITFRNTVNSRGMDTHFIKDEETAKEYLAIDGIGIVNLK